jgi:hypothetical protein
MFTKFHWPPFILTTTLPAVPAAESSAPIAAREVKAQVHPSFGNNFHNRTEPDPREQGCRNLRRSKVLRIFQFVSGGRL